ncbi:T9SS type A sorting domain-containing protein [Chryseolinea lacunae]|uniref:T9SS type A sorting domain-containing protein n=1 Tax=Chryseolinea lacunae TaxID=2801331 RepID=A0ABS1L250_9BACT|nr:T9SS type A sorting domain-containing protein [Chryseolinea lacunae]MBL0745598.1 T9SS type A sorting domain-containing protein [Chryseolinea lacunae]
MKTKRDSIYKTNVLHKSMLMMFLVLCTTLVKAQVSVGDSLALVEIYNQTQGPSWSSKTNWLTGKVSTWEGVTLTGSRVSELSLSSNNLTGTLGYHIGFLQELKVLNLSSNNLQGPLPLVFVFLQKLTILNLSENKFSGEIPATTGLLTSLTDLNLSKNQFSGPLPQTLVLLCKLKKLNLSDNALTGNLPSQLGLLTSLQGLYVSNNKLQGAVPASIGKLKKATDVYLDNNRFGSALPTTLGDMDSLVFFNAANNNITGAVPQTLTKLKRLYLFNVSGNDIADLPNLSSIASLFQLTVADNKLTFADIRPSIGKMLPGSYIPQDSVGTSSTVVACVGSSVVLRGDVIESDPNNRYTWFAVDGSFVSEESASPNLVLDGVTAANANRYSVAISNANVPDLYLFRKTIKLKVNTCATGGAGAKSTTSVYPVPFDNTTTVLVTTPAAEALHIAVRNESGIVQEQLDTTTNLETNVGGSLKKGTYYVESVYGSSRDVTRVVKK